MRLVKGSLAGLVLTANYRYRAINMIL